MAEARDIEFRDAEARIAESATTSLAGLPPGQEPGELQGEKMVLNVGPSHPATHGVLRIVLELDGEIITGARPEVGYLHRGDEKIAENFTYTQFIPYTDRLDYLAPLANNVAYALAVEKLLGIDRQLTPRCQFIRVHDLVGGHSAGYKSLYFFAYSFVGGISSGRQLFWLNLYYTGVCLDRKSVV